MAPLKVGDSFPEGVKFEYVPRTPHRNDLHTGGLAAKTCLTWMQVGTHHRLGPYCLRSAPGVRCQQGVEGQEGRAVLSTRSVALERSLPVDVHYAE
jgi:hypothetical protein